MQAISTLLTLFSILVPSKMWYAPTAPLPVTNKHNAAVTLVLTDFAGKTLEGKGATDVEAGKDADIKSLFPALSRPGAYVLWAVPKGKQLPDFIGTPLVVEVRSETRAGGPEDPLVIRVEPLVYATMSTEMGDMTMVFWFDVAPNTVDSFLGLASQGYYDGLTFHRIVPGFVIQGGDPHGDGVGGPGYNIDAEFNDRKHEEGVLSMARQGDPLEQQGMKPRCEFANSAGSQFFVCVATTPHLDGKYTGFGRVVEGMETYKAIEKVKIVDPRAGKPEKAPVIKKVEVRPVTPEKNPYAAMFGMKK